MEIDPEQHAMAEKLPDLCKCDVKDKQKLAIFREKRAEWREAIIGNDTHSIKNQVTSILWEDAIFRTVNEARRLSAHTPNKDKGFNDALINILDRGFVAAQMMAIRRLTDKGSHDPDRAVISLPTVLDDIERNLNLLTREHYICYDGTLYECPPSGDIEYFHWQQRQEIFDRLSGIDKKHRRRSDVVRKSLISKLRDKLYVCDDFRIRANKFIAHAAIPSKKRDLIAKERLITLKKFDEAYQTIVQISSFLGAVMLYEHEIGNVPTPQCDLLKNFDKPMVLKGDLDFLSKFWHERVAEVGKWGSTIWPD